MDKIRLCGLWKNQKDGKSYLSGNLTPGARLLIFPNGFKSGDTDPDYIVYVVENRKQGERGTSTPSPEEDSIPF